MFFDCTADLVGQLNGNSQKGMLQIDAPSVENNFWLYATGFKKAGGWLAGEGRRSGGQRSLSTLLTQTSSHLAVVSGTSASSPSWTRRPISHVTRPPHIATLVQPATRLTKYPTTILRLFYDNAKVTIDFRRTSDLQNILRRTQLGLFSHTIHIR